jgi:hypothetical protein
MLEYWSQKRHWVKHVSAATNQHVTIEELLETAFSMRFVLRIYRADYREK